MDTSYDKTDYLTTTMTPNDQLVSQLGKDYSEYLTIPSTNERQQFDDSIEGMLTRLDEYLGLVSLIRSDTNLCLETTLPVIQNKSEEMTKIFERIDRLEAFVTTVKQNMSVMEDHLTRAETDLGSLSSLRKMFTNISMPSFLSKSKPSRQPSSKASAPKKFIPPEIFKTTDFLHYTAENQAGATASSQTLRGSQYPPQGQTSSVISGEDFVQEESGTWPTIGET